MASGIIINVPELPTSNVSPNRYTPPILRTTRPEKTQACGSYQIEGTLRNASPSRTVADDYGITSDTNSDTAIDTSKLPIDSKRVSFDDNLERVLEIPNRFMPEVTEEFSEDESLPADEHPAVKGNVLCGKYTLSKKPKKPPNRNQTKKSNPKPKLQRRNSQNTKSGTSAVAFKGVNSVYTTVQDVKSGNKTKTDSNCEKLKLRHSLHSGSYNNTAINISNSNTQRRLMTPKSTAITQYDNGQLQCSRNPEQPLVASTHTVRDYFPTKSVSARRVYAWQLANGAPPPETITPSISPMWNSRYHDMDSAVVWD